MKQHAEALRCGDFIRDTMARNAGELGLLLQLGVVNHVIA